jgi:23S rRNA (adenine-N6)-dimethyltransferase
VQRDDLVLDLGAGTGVLTAELARRTRRVIAVEIDPVLAAGLRRRFPDVQVLSCDVLNLRLPSDDFKVVANPPFDGATTLLRRLLDPRVPLVSADVIVQWGLASKRAAVWPSTQLGTYWGAWFELSVSRRLPRCVFAPPPAVDAAVLHVVRREQPLVPVADRRAYGHFLARGYRDGVRAVVPWRLLKQWESELGFDRQAHPRDLDAWQWAGLYSRAVRRTV